MKKTIEIDFVEEAPVEILALTASAHKANKDGAARRDFWLGWQLFGSQ